MDPDTKDEDLKIPEDETEVEDGEGEEADDAGRDDDEGGDEAEGRQVAEGEEAEERQVEGQEQRKPGRAERAVLQAKREAREAKEAAQRLQTEIQSLRAERAQPKQETESEERARLALMTTDERVTYLLEKAAKQNAHQIGLMRFESADRADKAGYDAKASYDPRYKRFAGEVEQQLAESRRAGMNPNREVILAYVIGTKVLGAKPKVEQQRRAGKARIERQQARAESGRSDRPAERSRSNSRTGSLADLERRLDGVIL